MKLILVPSEGMRPRVVNSKCSLIVTSNQQKDVEVAEKLFPQVNKVKTGWLYMEEDYPGSDQEIDRFASKVADLIREELRSSVAPLRVALVGSQTLLLSAVAALLFPDHRTNLYSMEGMFLHVSREGVVAAV